MIKIQEASLPVYSHFLVSYGSAAVMIQYPNIILEPFPFERLTTDLRNKNYDCETKQS